MKDLSKKFMKDLSPLMMKQAILINISHNKIIWPIKWKIMTF
jgi:hypothetical protein